MKLIIDSLKIPGKLVDLSRGIANSFGIEAKLVRERDKDLYRLASDDFDFEQRQQRSYEALKPILDDMEPGDILITDDVDLASEAFPKLTAIIGSDGQVFTKERIERLEIKKHLDRIKGVEAHAKSIFRSDNTVNEEEIKKTLYQYLGNL